MPDRVCGMSFHNSTCHASSRLPWILQCSVFFPWFMFRTPSNEKTNKVYSANTTGDIPRHKFRSAEKVILPSPTKHHMHRVVEMRRHTHIHFASYHANDGTQRKHRVSLVAVYENAAFRREDGCTFPATPLKLHCPTVVATTTQTTTVIVTNMNGAEVRKRYNFFPRWLAIETVHMLPISATELLPAPKHPEQRS